MATRRARAMVKLAALLGFTFVLLWPLAARADTPARPAPKHGLGHLTTVALDEIRPGSPPTKVRVTAKCSARSSDSNLWILAAGGPPPANTQPRDWIIRVTAEGHVTHYPIASSNLSAIQSPQCMVVGHDGNLWYAETGRNPGNVTGLVRFNVHSHHESFTPIDLAWPVALAASPTGDIWIAEENAPDIDRVDKHGHIATFARAAGTEAIPTYGVGQGPTIAVMPDGTIWISGVNSADKSLGSIFELDRNGNVVRRFDSRAYLLVAGPGDVPWYAFGGAGGAVGRVQSESTKVDLPWLHGNTFPPASMALSADGRSLWWADSGSPRFGIFDLKGTSIATEWLAPAAATGPIGPGPGLDMSFVSNSTLYRIQSEPGILLPRIARELVKPSDAFNDLGKVATRLGVAGVAAIFVTFPAHLFNLTFQEQHDTIVAWWRRRRRPVERARQRLRDARGRFLPTPHAGRWVTEVLPFLAVVLGGTILGTLLDPSVGFDLTSLASFIAVLIAILGGVLLSAIVAATYLRARFGPVRPHLRGLPRGLAVAALTVGISRWAAVRPGYLYGVVAGVGFESELDDDQQTRMSALAVGTVIAMGIAAWVVFGLVRPDGERSSFGGAVVANLPAALCLAGLTGCVIELLPVGFLPGWKLFRWNWRVWLAMFVLAVFVLGCATQVTVQNVRIAALFFVIFGVISFAFRAALVLQWRSRSPERRPGFAGFVRDYFSYHPSGQAHLAIGIGEAGPDELEITTLPPAAKKPPARS